MSYHLGVDLGTTYSAAAVFRDGRAEVVSLGTRSADIPSIVFLKEDESILVGDAAGRRGVGNPARVVREFKRRFGDPTPIMLGGTPISADAVWAKLLSWILEEVRKSQGADPETVVITHPANWGPYKLDLLNQAIRLAGTPNPSILSEPEAAATHYATANRVEPGEVVAVYDLGGGTFDAAILTKTETGFELLGRPEGIERLGGIDVDEAVFAHVMDALGADVESLDPADAAVQSAVARLRQECIGAKEALSQDTDASIPVILPNLSTEVRLTRAELEAMIRPTLSPTVDSLRRAIESAGLQPEDLSMVLLVGGSSRIPMVGQMVAQAFGRPIAIDAHPKHSVALGAAVRAAAGTAPAPPGAITPAATKPVPPAPGPPTKPIQTPTGAPAATPPVVQPAGSVEAEPEPAPTRARERQKPKAWMAGAGAALVLIAWFMFFRSGSGDGATRPDGPGQPTTSVTAIASPSAAGPTLPAAKVVSPRRILAPIDFANFGLRDTYEEAPDRFTAIYINQVGSELNFEAFISDTPLADLLLKLETSRQSFFAPNAVLSDTFAGQGKCLQGPALSDDPAPVVQCFWSEGTVVFSLLAPSGLNLDEVIQLAIAASSRTDRS